MRQKKTFSSRFCDQKTPNNSIVTPTQSQLKYIQSAQAKFGSF